MNYSKLRSLVRNTKVSKDEFLTAIKMSEVGFNKMLKMETCKVETLELISKFFKVSIIYFFDDQNTKVYPENTDLMIVQEEIYKPSRDEKDIIIEKQDQFIEKLENTIKLLIEKIGGEFHVDHSKPQSLKANSQNIKGFRQIQDSQIKMIIENLFPELQTR